MERSCCSVVARTAAAELFTIQPRYLRYRSSRKRPLCAVMQRPSADRQQTRTFVREAREGCGGAEAVSEQLDHRVDLRARFPRAYAIDGVPEAEVWEGHEREVAVTGQGWLCRRQHGVPG